MQIEYYCGNFSMTWVLYKPFPLSESDHPFKSYGATDKRTSKC